MVDKTELAKAEAAVLLRAVALVIVGYIAWILATDHSLTGPHPTVLLVTAVAVLLAGANVAYLSVRRYRPDLLGLAD